MHLGFCVVDAFRSFLHHFTGWMISGCLGVHTALTLLLFVLRPLPPHVVLTFIYVNFRRPLHRFVSVLAWSFFSNFSILLRYRRVIVLQTLFGLRVTTMFRLACALQLEREKRLPYRWSLHKLKASFLFTKPVWASRRLVTPRWMVTWQKPSWIVIMNHPTSPPTGGRRL